MQRKLPDDFSLLCELRSARSVPMNSEVIRHMKMSVLHEKYYVHRDFDDVAVGYVIWADISLETFMRLSRTGSFPRYFHEWNEGKIRLLLDIFVRRGVSVEAMWDMKKKLAADVEQIAYFRKGRLRLRAHRAGRFVARPPDELLRARGWVQRG